MAAAEALEQENKMEIRVSNHVEKLFATLITFWYLPDRAIALAGQVWMKMKALGSRGNTARKCCWAAFRNIR